MESDYEVVQKLLSEGAEVLGMRLQDMAALMKQSPSIHHHGPGIHYRDVRYFVPDDEPVGDPGLRAQRGLRLVL
jgi:hypothetical protein